MQAAAKRQIGEVNAGGGDVLPQLARQHGVTARHHLAEQFHGDQRNLSEVRHGGISLGQPVMLDEETGVGVTLNAYSGNECDCSNGGFAEVMFIIAADCDDGTSQSGR